MKRKAHIILLVLLLLCVLSTTAFAIDDSEVESAIAASSKEEVAGNVFIWFLCAIGFLKVSQKIDSFMASLGINVGRTGGSMLTELMVAGRGIAAVAGAVGGTVFNHHSSSNSTHTNAQAAGAAFTGGGNGLVGVTRRAAGNAAAASATGNAKGLSNLVGGAMFESSLQNGGKFAMSVVGAVAKGSISSVGSINGDQAAEALTSYLGYSPVDSGSALADDGGLIPPSPITSEDVVTLDGGTAAGTASPSLAVLIPCVLYAAGIIAQFIININAWKAAGSDYRISPGLPSSQISEVVRALFHFPEGLIAIGVVVLGIAVLCVFGLRIGWGQNGVTDSDRNLTVSNSGSYGTASFMSPKEASACFEVTSAKRTSQDILGMLPDGQVLTLPKDTRLNANLAVCGSSGTGKSRAISRNLVLQAVKRGESVILTDPKSELYESMGEYLRENGYIVKVFNLVEMDHSDSWNCLGEVGSSELMAQTFADIVLQNTSGDSKDAFWYNAELNLLKALVLYVALEMPPEKRNIATVYDLLYTQTEKGLSDMMASISHEHANQYTGELLPPSPASAPYAIFRQSSETVRTSVIIGLGSKLAVLQAQQVRNITSYNEIDLELPGKQKCAYFCIVSDQDSTYDFLSSLFFSFLFIRLIRYADAYCEGGMLHPKVKFILDEFPNCCLIPDFTKKCSTIRSRGCSVAVFFQNVGQMRNRYPDDQWQEILGACDSTVFLGCTDMLTAEYFSDRIGTASVEVEGTMRELNTMHITDYTPRFRKTNSLGRRPLLTPDEVLRLPPDQVLIFIRGQKVMRAKRFDYSLHPDYKKLKSRKAILHEPDWKNSQASSVSASGVSSPSVTAAIPAEKANVGSQKKLPGKPPRSTTRKVVNADELF